MGYIIGYLRALLAAVVFLIALLLGALMHFITFLIGYFNEEARESIRYSYVHGACRVIWFFIQGPTQIIGLENVPADRPCVFIGNHRSILDIVVVLAYMKKPVGFIAKQELKKVPILAMLMEDIHCLFLDREDPRQGLKTILTAIDQVKGGLNMFVFPEGTRSRTEGQFLPFHAGSFKIATKPGAPIVPVTIVNCGDLMEDHFPRVKWVKVLVEFGKPIETEGMDRQTQKDLPDLVRSQIMETYAQHEGIVLKKAG